MKMRGKMVNQSLINHLCPGSGTEHNEILSVLLVDISNAFWYYVFMNDMGKWNSPLHITGRV
jgi:hypothetical protein